LAVGPNGNVYVTDFSQRVTELTPSGNVLRRWGSRGHGPGQFDFLAPDPSAPKQVAGLLAIGPHGDVYVSDSGNSRVEVFSADGRFLRQFGRPGTGLGRFDATFALAVDPAGNVYVLDGKVQGLLTKFSPNGRPLWQVGAAGSDAPFAGLPMHTTAVDSHGRLVLNSDQNGEVYYLDGGGHVVDSFNANPHTIGLPFGPCSATVDDAGNVYATECGQGQSCSTLRCSATLVFDRTHQLIAEWDDPGGPLNSGPAFGPNREVFTITPDGSIVRLRPTLPNR
jgi:sugar lactone lactonase YvrE